MPDSDNHGAVRIGDLVVDADNYLYHGDGWYNLAGDFTNNGTYDYGTSDGVAFDGQIGRASCREGE